MTESAENTQINQLAQNADLDPNCSSLISYKILPKYVDDKKGKFIFKFIPINKRSEISSRLMLKHPDRIPIIIEKHITDSFYNFDDSFVESIITNKSETKLCTKILMHRDNNIMKLLQLLRDRDENRIGSHSGIYLYINDKIMLKSDDKIDYLYSQYKHEDGFLYIKMAFQEVFGF